MRKKPSASFPVLLIRCLLAAAAAVMLFLAVSTAVRSIRTAQVNDALNRLHEEASAGVAPAEDSRESPGSIPARKTISGTVSLMGFPDGSSIPMSSGADGKSGSAEQAAAFHRIGNGGAVLKEMQELKRINRDTVGWISIDSVLNLPVVYRDNTWYLNHDFYGERNASGTLFLDQYHPLESGTQNLLIHGHKMKDGSMFAMLTHYTTASFLKAHSLITFSTLWEKEVYQVFAVLRVSSREDDPNYFNYFSHSSFTSEADYTDYIRRLKLKAVQRTDMQADPGKALLTLSTCYGDDRIVVVAQRIL